MMLLCDFKLRMVMYVVLCGTVISLAHLQLVWFFS